MENNKLYDFLKSKNITESSLKLYLNNLKRLNSGEFPKNFNFLKDVDKVVEKLNKYKPNTRRSYFISIVTILKHEPKLKKLYDKYYSILEVYNKEGSVNNTKSKTQQDNWINQDEVKNIYDKVTEEVKSFLEKKKLNASEYEKMLRWVVLSLYVLQKPRRNMDYQKMLVGYKIPTDLNNDYNFLDLSNKKFIFNNYKTKGTYKTQEVDVTDDMFNVINLFLKFHPNIKQLKKNKQVLIPLLVDFEGKQLPNINSITRILNTIFGKKIGVSMLRSIYLTDKYSDQSNEMKEDASAMGTSTNVIQNQYIKEDDNDKKE